MTPLQKKYIDSVDGNAHQSAVQIIGSLEDALRDMVSGWKYIREYHGDLYGVGWDRAQHKAESALTSNRHLDLIQE